MTGEIRIDLTTAPPTVYFDGEAKRTDLELTYEKEGEPLTVEGVKLRVLPLRGSKR